MENVKLKYGKETESRIDEVSGIINYKGMVDKFYSANNSKVNKGSNTTKKVHRDLEQLADYILESENLTTKKNEYNILDQKRLKDVELNEQALPSYSNEDEETTVEGELTNALINKERLLKHEDTVYQLLKNDYELINNGAILKDLWFYQTLQNKDAKGLVADSFNLIEFYLGKIHNTVNKREIQVCKRRIKDILFGDIGSIVRSYTKLEPYQNRQGKQFLEFDEDIATNKHFYIFKTLVADKNTIIIPTDIIPIVDLESAIKDGIESGYLNNKEVEIIQLLKNHYKGDLIACLKAKGKYTTNRYRFEKLINKLENIC